MGNEFIDGWQLPCYEGLSTTTGILQMSNTKTNSNAAKDDTLSLPGTYKLSALLANDAGSAEFFSFDAVTGANGAGVHDNHDGTFTVDVGVTSFQYQITTGHGNGTHSIATVKVDSPELVKNWSFEDNATNPVPVGGYTINQSIAGWTTDPSSHNLEVVEKTYENVGTGPNASDGHWLDTQASPGAIDISQVISGLKDGQHAQMTFKVAAENIASYGQQTTDNESVDIMFGDKFMQTITMSDFAKTDGTGTDFNNFHTFTANIVGGADDTLRIVSHGSANVGFAVDSVSIKALAFPSA